MDPGRCVNLDEIEAEGGLDRKGEKGLADQRCDMLPFKIEIVVQL